MLRPAVAARSIASTLAVLAAASLGLLRCSSSDEPQASGVGDAGGAGGSQAAGGAAGQAASGQGGTTAAGQGGAGAGGEGGGAAGEGGSAGDAGEGGQAGAGPAGYTLTPFDDTRITSDGAGPNFQKATAEIDLHDGPFASVKLVVALTSSCFPFEKWKANPPPAGQNWPAECDAFDRNFEFTLDEPKADGEQPAIELLRAITPFGGPLGAEVDITDIANGLPGAHTLHVNIPTYSDGAGKVSGSHGGWNVTATIVATPGVAPRNVLAVKPLLNWSQGADATVPVIDFDVPEGTTASRIEYRVTGHGGGAIDTGCIGPAEEFCKRKHTPQIDGANLKGITPWRTDCKDLCTVTQNTAGVGPKSYCAENPCGAVQSVQAPRANWCPGSVTPPFVLEPPALATPGAHTFSYAISPAVAPGGLWRVSAVFIALGP
jgi:hypothetical protein